jgi:hypothetical protein
MIYHPLSLSRLSDFFCPSQDKKPSGTCCEFQDITLSGSVISAQVRLFKNHAGGSWQSTAARGWVLKARVLSLPPHDGFGFVIVGFLISRQVGNLPVRSKIGKI